MEGLIIRSTGSWYSVKNSEGEIVECKLKGNFKIKGIRTTNPIAVGDKVRFDLLKDKEIGLIHGIEDRKNYIIRKSTNLSKRSHIIASNLDQAMLVISIAKPRTSTGFIDRFLITAEAYSIPAILVFNKIDIHDEEISEIHDEYKAIYENAGYQCIDVSALKNTNIDKLRELMRNKTSLFSGHSGVGKSALANALDNNLDIRTGEISDAHLKGKHTTTYAQMHSLEFGANIIDTPGIKEFGLIDFEKSDLGHYYPEFRELMSYCKFHNCTHEHEPNCAIIGGVENGVIPYLRYENYLRILNGEELDATPEYGQK